jgi:uncharacterized protein (DUF1697 family)
MVMVPGIEAEGSRRGYSGGKTMIYVALLRGINVGGNNKISMKELKESFEKIGLQSVTTYINSGNVVFEDETNGKEELEALLNQMILTDFQLNISVLVRSLKEFAVLMRKVPEHWENDGEMKCDVLFLADSVDGEETLERLTIKPGIDTVVYVPGAILWSVERKNVTKSGLMKIVGTELYKQMTVRNVNTTRKLYDIMNKVKLKAASLASGE